MKKRILLLSLILITSIVSFSQSLRTEKYEMYLIDIVENTVSISEGMYMIKKAQNYYEGTIEVICMETGNILEYNFYFSVWDDIYKEFVVKSKDRTIIEPKISFKDKNTAIVLDNKLVNLKNNSSIDNAILSSMVVWLDSKEKKID